jgi:hypothetical protein
MLDLQDLSKHDEDRKDDSKVMVRASALLDFNSELDIQMHGESAEYGSTQIPIPSLKISLALLQLLVTISLCLNAVIPITSFW